MQVRFAFILVSIAILIAACQGPPPTEYVREVTRVQIVTATPEGGTSVTAQNADTTDEPTTTSTKEPAETPSPTLTPTVDPFPTPVMAQIFVAEQRFENGRLFWLQPVNQIWVMAFDEDENPIWSVYDDDFEDGEPEFDPTIIPPTDMLQPERGFGKLWRENPEVRSSLGWAIEIERGHTTRYEYHHGGIVNTENEYIADDGYHVVESLYGDVFQFIEGEWTWALQDAAQ